MTVAEPVSRSDSVSRVARPAQNGSTLYVEIPKGEKTGNLEVRPHAQALNIEHDASGKATAVVYAR